MLEKNSPVVIAIVLAALGALWLVLRAVTVWAAPPATKSRREWPMSTSPEAAADAGLDDDAG